MLSKTGIIKDSYLIEKINSFRTHKFNCYKQKFTTKEEIDMMNNILNNVIKYLESRLVLG